MRNVLSERLMKAMKPRQLCQYLIKCDVFYRKTEREKKKKKDLQG